MTSILSANDSVLCPRDDDDDDVDDRCTIV